MINGLVRVVALLALFSRDAFAAGGSLGEELPLWSVIPFAGILLSIALFPLLLPKFWHHHFGKVALAWSALFLIPFAIWKGVGSAIEQVGHVYVVDFIPFIILLWALFTVAGGIRLKGSLRGTPMVNTAILLIGTVLASWMGTTGAAMLLIRPILRANAWRKHRVHTVVFFIFLVANIGGCLTPLGDPPLFLGFLHGISFFWTASHLFLPMIFLSVSLLVIYFIMDSFLMKKEDSSTAPTDGSKEKLGIEGGINFLFLGGIVAAILYSGTASTSSLYHDAEKAASYAPAIEAAERNASEVETRLKAAAAAEKDALKRELLTAKTKITSGMAQRDHAAIKGIHLSSHITVPYVNLVRDGILILMGILSLRLTSRESREKNGFSWGPILEVAKLFAGIFVTIIPALEILKAGPNGALASIVMTVTSDAGQPINSLYFWFSGMLSSFLDNAPTYLVFYNTAGGNAQWLMNEGAGTLMAVSAGSVYMGANTYIGNAPNFMVRSIAEEAGVTMPSFFGYIVKWSLIFLVPLFAIMTFLFF